MERKVRVPEWISAAIGQLGLGRELLVTLENIIHHGIQAADRTARFSGDERCFVFQTPVVHEGMKHIFVVVVDDTTSPDDFIIQAIQHASYNDL